MQIVLDMSYIMAFNGRTGKALTHIVNERSKLWLTLVLSGTQDDCCCGQP